MVTDHLLELTITWANWKRLTMIGSNVRLCLGGKIVQDRAEEHNGAFVLWSIHA